MTTAALRPELTELPYRMKRLPLDHRGYPVPWFVQWMKDGKAAAPFAPGAVPEFRVMDRQKWIQAVREHRCWVCGEPLGVYKVFVVGPMCGINRTTAEPPSHLDCGLWSAVNCPFLARPHMVRREDDFTEPLKANAAGEMLDRNPGVTLLWTTKTMEVWSDPKGAPLITMGDPLHVRFFSAGRPASRGAVLESVNSGYPALWAMAEKQDADERGTGARAALTLARERFERLLPPAI